ncbi:MAG: helix-turn-helix domain-containing protein [Lachnospiraceae bacterium]
MQWNDLFEQRKVVGMKLKEYLRSKGFSKVSFCEKADISRPTFNKILNGEVENKNTFDKHMQKIFSCIHIAPEELLEFSGQKQAAVEVVYSKNEPEAYQMDEKAKKEYDLLQDLLNLCGIYY